MAETEYVGLSLTLFRTACIIVLLESQLIMSVTLIPLSELFLM